MVFWRPISGCGPWCGGRGVGGRRGFTAPKWVPFGRWMVGWAGLAGVGKSCEPCYCVVEEFDVGCVGGEFQSGAAGVSAACGGDA